MIKVLLVDDHEMIVQGLSTYFDSEDGIKVVGTANNGNQALEMLNKKAIDVVLTDILMPEMDGIDLLRELKKRSISTPVVFLTMNGTPSYVKLAIEAGASGYVSKNRAIEELTLAINEVVQGGVYVDKYTLREVFNIIKSGATQPAEQSLTDRQRSILKMINDGKTSQEIADALKLSSNTVETHKRNMVSKLGLKGMKELYRIAADLFNI